MKRSLLSLVFLSAFALRMSDADSAAPATDAPADAPQAPAAPVTVTIADVPAHHADLLERVGALLKKDLGWLKDNIEAGVSHFEAMFANPDDSKTGD